MSYMNSDYRTLRYYFVEPKIMVCVCIILPRMTNIIIIQSGYLNN